MSDVIEFNVITKESKERPFTQLEREAYENEKKLAEIEKLQLDKIKKARQEVLEKLGLTEGEAEVLLGQKNL